MKKTLILLTVLTCLIIVGVSMKSGKKTSFKAGTHGPYQASPTKEEGDVVHKDIEDLLRRTR